MPIIWARDATSEIESVKATFSSWDSCMSKTYCKWPVIAAIIIGGLIVFSLLFCLARCICCGAECCCGCLACCNACCPSPSRNKNSGYQRASAPPPLQQHPFNQYQSPVPPAYNPNNAYSHGAQTATFDAPTSRTGADDDALPPMPSWDDARTRRVERDSLPQYESKEGDIVEMDKFDSRPGTTEPHLLAHQPSHGSMREHGLQSSSGIQQQPYYQDEDQYHNSNESHTGYSYSQGPSNDYDGHHQQTAPSSIYDPSEQYSVYGQSQHGYVPPPASTYHNYTSDPVQRGPYASPPPPSVSDYGYPHSTGPPSYRTGPPSILSPGGSTSRRPVNGSWRNV